MLWYDYLNYGLLIILWILILFSFKKHYSERRFWILYFGLYTLTEVISLPFSLKGVNNLWLYNISKPIQFVLLVLYFLNILGIKKKSIILIAGIVLLMGCFFRVKTDIQDYNSFEDIVFGSGVVILCVMYLYRLIKAEEYINLDSTEFWFCGSLFIFFGTNLCVTGVMNFLIKSQFEIARKLFYILVVNSIIYYGIIFYSLISANGWVKKQK